MISIFFLFSLLGSASCVRRCRRVGAGSAILQSLTEERLLLAAAKRMRGSSSSSSMTTKKIAASPFLRSQRDRRSDTVVPMRAAMQESLLTLASVDNNFVLGLEVWRLAWPFLLVWLLQRQMPVSPSVPVKKSRAQWREELTSEQFKVMVNRGTEMAFTSKLNVEKRNGTYTCAGCGNPLFLASQKDSNAVEQTVHPIYLFPDFRTREVRCKQCGSHLGHVFGDGPEPTGRRYCINGVSLDFKPDPTAPSVAAEDS